MKSQSQLRIAEVTALAYEVFGTKEKANAWLTSTNLIFQEPPISIANKSESGLTEIKRVLYAISYGGCV